MNSVPDSLVFITRENVRLAVPVKSVTRMEMALGLRNRQREGVIAGVLAGGLAGAVVGASSATKDATLTGSSYPTLGDPTTSGILGALAGGLAGAFVGGFIGHNMRTDRWQEVKVGSLNVSAGLRVGR